MQVILLEDVQNLGHEGDAVTVADGFARNHLLPRKLAVEATKGALKDLQQRQRAIERRQAEKRDKAAAQAEQLAEHVIVIEATVGEGGRLHGQITPQQIADAIGEQLDVELGRRDIEIAEPIRQTGDYLVTASLYKGVRTQLAISVVAAEGEEEEEVEREVEPEAEVEAEAEGDAAIVEEPGAEAEEEPSIPEGPELEEAQPDAKDFASPSEPEKIEPEGEQ